MKRPVDLLPEAERELEGAVFWYERQRSGLGLEFLFAFAAAVESARRLPLGPALVALRTRKVLLRRFPYLVMYAVEEERIVITAVLHGHQDPGKWSERVREVPASKGALDVAPVSR